MTTPAAEPLLVAEVGVPIPITGTLSYSVPARWRSLAKPGVRARVRVGSRVLVGIILSLGDDPPPDLQLKELDEIIDLEPLLPNDLLELADFAARYYLSPIGEMLGAMIPGPLTPWGSERVRLLSGGALDPTSDADERAVIEALLSHGPSSVARLVADLQASSAVGEAIFRLAAKGRIRVESPATGGRYVSAVELVPGDLESQLETCGRSPKARAVVELLAALERPATVGEVTREVGCGDSVVRRLAGLGLLRRFQEPVRSELGRHYLGGTDPTAAEIQLRPDQALAADALECSVVNEGFSAFLLAGITGSGKTEVYLRAIRAALDHGRSAIVLVPEIALVPSLARTLKERFDDQVAILHSAMSRAERQQEWRRIRSGEASVVLGPRSAVFAPVAKLGVLIVDEEHDSSYKQEVSPRYNGRDLALVRARSENATVVLVSATPSLETRYNVGQAKYGALELHERVGGAELPSGLLVDLRKERFRHQPGEIHFSELLRAEIERANEQGSQSILLRNRRGYSPMLLCRACGEDMRCPECGLARTYHRRRRQLICHYCGSTIAAPVRCPACGEEALEPIGAGTERVEEEFRRLFPGVAVDVLDRDATQRPGGAAAVLERFRTGTTRVLIGTQMVSKGHHFPSVALAAVLSADSYLGFPDFRAVERTYSLLTQLAGRAGRGSTPGRVVIQTHHPEHYAIRAALDQDDAAFAAQEMRFRRTFHYPPYSRVILLLVRHRDRCKAEQTVQEVSSRLHRHPLAQGVRVTGPAPAPLERLRGRWRFQILLRGSSGAQLRKLVTASGVLDAGDDLSVDVDPYALL